MIKFTTSRKEAHDNGGVLGILDAKGTIYYICGDLDDNEISVALTIATKFNKQEDEPKNFFSIRQAYYGCENILELCSHDTVKGEKPQSIILPLKDMSRLADFLVDFFGKNFGK